MDTLDATGLAKQLNSYSSGAQKNDLHGLVKLKQSWHVVVPWKSVLYYLEEKFLTFACWQSAIPFSSLCVLYWAQ